MNRPYTATSPYSLTPTERIRGPRGGGRYGSYGSYGDDDPDRFSDLDTDALPPFPGDGQHDYDTEDYDQYLDEERLDRRWIWIAGVAGAILFAAVITVSMILGGGDSGSVSATVATPTPSSAAPEPTSAPSPRAAAPAAPAAPSLPPETITTVTPTVEAPAATAPPVLPAPQAAPPPPPAAGTVTYRITGNRQLLDLVTVIYTDAQGALQTDVNVALPWSKTVVLNPGVTLSSMTATSVSGQLNCSIIDANGSLIAAQNNNSIITNCTR